MKIGDIIRQLRKARNMTQSDLASLLSVSTSTVGMYEQNRRDPDYETILHIAELFDVSADYLLGNTPSPSKKGVRIPVYGSVAAGIPIEAITDIEDYEDISEDMARNGEYIALRIKGHSMEPVINFGDVVIVRLQDTADDNDIAIVVVNGDEATCKRIKKSPEGVALLSANPLYDPMFYTNEQIENLPVRILGKVVELRRTLSF